MDPRIEKVLKLPAYIRGSILAVLAVLVVVGYFFLLYSPKMEELRSLTDDYGRLEAKLKKDRRIANNLPKFKAEYERMQQQLSQALSELPNKKEIPTLLTSISSLAKDEGLEILRFEPVAEVAKGFYAEVPVKMQLLGSYHQVGMFFDQIGKMSRIVNVSNLQMGKPKAEGGMTRVSIKCLATTFRFLDTAKAPVGKKKKGKARR